jgi:hypothetical protein
MSAREVVRRGVIWGIVAVFFAIVITLAVFGQYTALVGFSAFPVVGAIILTSRPRNGVGRYLLVVGLVCLIIMWGLDASLTALVPPWAEALMSAIAAGFWLGLPIVGVIYPSGRGESRLGRLLFWSLTALVAASVVVYLVDPAPMLSTGRANPFAVDSPVVSNIQTASAPFVVAIIVGIVVDVVLRARRATSLERLQYRWFVFGLVGVLAIVAVSFTIINVSPTAYDDVIALPATLALNGVPIAIGIAITRHGLYEIGRVVSRTVAYAVVTLLVIGVYALVVTSSTWLLPGLPSVGVAVATLLAAALFLPVRRRVQRFVDRRFDRERYDAEKVVDAFGEHLRTEVDPDATSGELLEAIENTLQPASVGLWTAGAR